jgi:hypothetical protein
LFGAVQGILLGRQLSLKTAQNLKIALQLPRQVSQMLIFEYTYFSSCSLGISDFLEMALQNCVVFSDCSCRASRFSVMKDSSVPW